MGRQGPGSGGARPRSDRVAAGRALTPSRSAHSDSGCRGSGVGEISWVRTCWGWWTWLASVPLGLVRGRALVLRVGFGTRSSSSTLVTEEVSGQVSWSRSEVSLTGTYVGEVAPVAEGRSSPRPGMAPTKSLEAEVLRQADDVRRCDP